MSTGIEIIDPEGDRRAARQRWVMLFTALLSLGLFSYPLMRDYSTKWTALKASRKFALYLSLIKTNSILKKTSVEARFKMPDQIEVYEVSSCGPYAQKTLVSSMKLSDFEPGVEFVPEPWVRENSPSREPYLPRFCYDPLYGSSVFADGLAHGAIFLAHRQDIERNRGEHLVQITVERAAGDLEIE